MQSMPRGSGLPHWPRPRGQPRE